METETAIVLLAAGGSSRMGQPKQLLAYGGKPLVRHAAETAIASACRPVFVVLGAHRAAVGAALDGLPLEIVVNEAWADGVGTSIRAGVEAAVRREVGAAILALADQPLLRPEIFDRLRRAGATSGPAIVASRYAGTVGVPALFRRDLFPRLRSLPADQGCKSLILAHGADALHVDCPEAEIDLDTPADYALAAIDER